MPSPIPASALVCPMLKDRSAKAWAAHFTRVSPTIFRGEVVSIRFAGAEKNGVPAYVVDYQVLENPQGSVPPTLIELWTPWCDAGDQRESKLACRSRGASSDSLPVSVITVFLP